MADVQLIRRWFSLRELDLAPNAYFVAWAQWAIHRIHARVLEHIAREVQARAPLE